MPLLLLLCVVASAKSQIINLEPGSVQGFTITTRSGYDAEVFLNIPYAAPPIGELRFEKPAATIPWKETRNGTVFGATCHPHARPAAVLPPPDEDCLTLNIIRPKKEAPSGGYPILLWVHGGGYEIGAASIYGYQGFANIYIPHDVIVVTIQYRVGVYELMIAAIKALSPYIHKFGVKPEDFEKWNRNRFIEFLKRVVLERFYEDQFEDAIEDVITRYADRDEEDGYEFYLDRYTEFISDTFFNVAAVDGILARRDAGWNMYAYSFDHYNDAIWADNVPKRLRGSPHVNEYPYIFEVFALGNYNMDEKERVVAEIIQQSFISFAKTG
ncbi:hypothetical protein Y032_0040g230 [Ancylostoma ceylanicum]|nr:hypothetical protein Y032_0040g230 [Ancylostoma ceylanicum]